MSRICDDEEEYLALCKKFGETPVDCYSSHAEELQRRAYPERYKQTKSKKIKKQNIETEVKIPVTQELFEAALDKLWGVLIKCYNQKPEFIEEKNVFYKVPNGFLRLRDYGGQVSVTYKGKREESEKFNCREEIEFKYEEEDLGKLELLFSRMGLKKEIEYTKQRSNFYFDDGPIASFDILPNGQRYIEIEDTPQTIQNIVELLGLKDCPIEKRSYLEIIHDDLKK
jgi:predicted adenylyl cyclase CyaB